MKKKVNNIPTLRDDGFKLIMSYYDSKEYDKKNINDFYIHGLADDTYEIQMPLPSHRQIQHSIILVTAGALEASSGFDNYIIEKNMMIVIPAGQITSLSFMSEDIEVYYLHFSDTYLSHSKVDLSEWLIRPVIKFADAELGHLLVLLKRMQQLNEDEKNADVIKLYLTTLLAEMKQSSNFRLRINFPAHERLTMEFKKLINYHITKDKSVSFYAEKLNVTPNHLNKSVKTTLSRSASELIDEMLILEAKILMQKNNLSISEIAFKIGFEDLSYFGRFFKKHTAHTPTEYRNMIDLSE
ncbi:helix-turn-helix domain-containing protein [Pedobacter westerhofensis]|uniref:helix-turn-helix domain-containing protein n=1 Tax=Pedobacter westerhofensis TaxID=425512 RepID=UPI00163DB1C3|nr:helix-turn-helix domain-containing protein [Pedobacter westerhofensis]